MHVSAVLFTAGALALVSAVAVARALVKRGYEQRTLARLPVGPDGVIRGAEPIDLPAPPGSGAVRAVLMLHGFGDTPQTLAYLAATLHARGWSVRVPLLPGHGRRLEEWAQTGNEDWLSAARSELDALRTTHTVVAVVGLSMGGALAAEILGDRGSPGVRALVLLAPYLAMPPWMRRLARWHRFLGLVIPYVKGSQSPSILDPIERDRNLAYGAATPHLVNELAGIAAAAWAALPSIGVPTLVVQSHNDNRVSPSMTEAAFARLTVGDKQLVWVDAGRHIITVDHGRDRVAAAVADWLGRWEQQRGKGGE